jgi:hypothetical protein
MAAGQSASLTEDILNESAVRDGSDYTITVTVTGDTLDSNIGLTPEATTTFLGGMSGSTAWDNVVTNIATGDVELTDDDTVAIITIKQNSTYFITADDVIDFIIPGASLKSNTPIDVTEDITVLNESPVLSFDGDLADGEPESSIQDGPTTFEITVDGNLWRSDITTAADALTSIKGMFSGAPEFAPLVSGLSSSDLALTGGGTILTITFEADPSYSITSDETVNVDVPTDLLQYPESFVASTTSFIISDLGSYLGITGTILGVSDEGDIRSGNYQIDITVYEDTWVSDVDTDPAKTEGLINSITSNPSSSGWDALLVDLLGGDQGVSNVSLSGNTVTINVPSKPDFDITEDISLSISVDDSVFTSASSPLSVSNFHVINSIDPYVVLDSDPPSLSETELNGAILIVNLYEDTWVAGTPVDLDNFTIISGANISIQDIDDISRESDDSLRIVLKFSGNFSTDQTLDLTIGADELNGGQGVSNINTLNISSVIEPVILDVQIDNQPIGIGDVVTATIIVEDDDNNDFEFVQGMIAERILTNLRRNGSSTTEYLIDFTVSEGSNPQYLSNEDIPVTDLQLRNGTALGNIYSTPISLDNDLIDTEAPDVDLISFNNGTYKVGDKVTATINGNEPGLFFDASGTVINSVPMTALNVNGFSAGAGIYQVDYIVSEGDPDVDPDVPALGPISITVALEDSAGNQDIYSLISGESPVIDANSPVIDSMRVITTGVVSSSTDIEIVIDAGEPGLDLAPGSHVNNVYMSSGRLDLDDDGGGFYTLTYDVSPDDNGVSSGGLTADIILKDSAGNTSADFTTLKNNTVSIITEGPEAIIYGGGAICEGESITIYLTINGEGPFDVSILDGTDPFDSFTGIPSTYSFTVTPASDLQLTVGSISDALGNPGTSSGIVEVIVHENPGNVKLTLPRTTYQVTEDSVSLSGTGTPIGGVYSGEGVLSDEELFSPKLVGVANSPATIYYTYTEPATGCSSQASKDVTIIEGQAQFTTFPDDNLICYGEPNVSIAAENNYGSDGWFDLTYRTFGDYNHVFTESPLLDAITLNTNLLEEGSYVVRYSYNYYDPIFGLGIRYYIEQSFFVEKLDEVKYISRPPATICNDQPIVDLESNLDDPNISYSFSGSGVTGNPSSGYSFNPADAALGINQINYEMTSSKGCSKSDAFTVEVFDVPDVDFMPQSVCIPLDGGPIGFNNLTDKEGLVDEWRWAFGDINSGAANTDTLDTKVDVIHNYTAPGTRNVSLEVLTQDGCVSKKVSTIDFGDKPIADFRWTSDCYLSDIPVTFVNESFTERTWIEDLDAVLDSVAFTYTFFDDQMNLIHTIESTEKESVDYMFGALDDYYVRLVAVNDLNCADTLTDYIVLKPTTSLKDTAYSEAFGTRGFWSARADSLSETNRWTFGVPDFAGYETGPDDNAWFTQFTQAAENLAERSWMQSPCYDFRDTERPMIRMDIMKSFDLNRDGAVLQYSLDNGKNWTTVGNIGEGLNWYNSFNIKEKPGGNDGSSIGWSGSQLFRPDTTWVNVAHDLDDLIGEESVIFGLFYATDGASVVNSQGIAFDNIYIGERRKRAILEHFTNSGDPDADEADQEIDNFVAANSKDVVSLQYHMHFPGDDPINEDHPVPASSRSFFYGVNEVPRAIIDGGTKPEHLFDFLPDKPTATVLKELTLEDPEFAIDLTFRLHEERLGFTAEITALADRDSSDVVLQVAILEKSITGYTGDNGDTEFRNVVLAMVPSPAGTLYSNAWGKNDSETYSNSWRYEGVEDLSDLMVVAFLQDRATKKVLQVVSEDQPEYGLPIATHHAGTIMVYPNPFREFVRVELGENARADGMIMLTDVSGRIVSCQGISKGESEATIRTAMLESGTYFLLWREAETVKARATILKVD